MNRTPVVDKPDVDILWQCLLTGGLGSIAGLGALLRNPGELDRRSFLAAIINSGLFSLAAACLIFWKFGTNQVPLAIAVSIMTGLGGHSLLDFALGAIRLALTQKLRTDDDDSPRR